MKKARATQSKKRKKKGIFQVASEPLPSSDHQVELGESIKNSASSADTELPTSYGTNIIFLTAQGPRCLFTYWDINTSSLGKKIFLRCIQADGSLESETEIPTETQNWYLPVSKAGNSYFVELGYYHENQWNKIAQSATTQAPLDQLSSTDSSWNTALASWTTETLASWGASETSSWENTTPDENTDQDFFMHVNAEVIFYGNTCPGSSVTIDSKPIKINPDGSFRYHFIFPDEAYEVPIVSQSPDGQETRAAVLRFHRISSHSLER